VTVPGDQPPEKSPSIRPTVSPDPDSESDDDDDDDAAAPLTLVDRIVGLLQRNDTPEKIVQALIAYYEQDDLKEEKRLWGFVEMYFASTAKRQLRFPDVLPERLVKKLDDQCIHGGRAISAEEKTCIAGINLSVDRLKEGKFEPPPNSAFFLQVLTELYNDIGQHPLLGECSMFLRAEKALWEALVEYVAAHPGIEISFPEQINIPDRLRTKVNQYFPPPTPRKVDDSSDDASNASDSGSVKVDSDQPDDDDQSVRDESSSIAEDSDSGSESDEYEEPGHPVTTAPSIAQPRSTTTTVLTISDCTEQVERFIKILDADTNGLLTGLGLGGTLLNLYEQFEGVDGLGQDVFFLPAERDMWKILREYLFRHGRIFITFQHNNLPKTLARNLLQYVTGRYIFTDPPPAADNRPRDHRDAAPFPILPVVNRNEHYYIRDQKSAAAAIEQNERGRALHNIRYGPDPEPALSNVEKQAREARERLQEKARENNKKRLAQIEADRAKERKAAERADRESLQLYYANNRMETAAERARVTAFYANR
jgi:hypothetical protein